MKNIKNREYMFEKFGKKLFDCNSDWYGKKENLRR